MTTDRRLDRRTFLWAGGATVAGLLASASCGSQQPATTWQRIGAAGRLRVAIADEAPYGYIDHDGQLTGAFPDVVRAVAATLGIDRLDGVVVPFGSLIDTLLAGRADVIGAGMTVTAERCARVAFGRPDLHARTALGVGTGNPLHLSDYDSLVAADATVGVLRGAVEAADVDEAGVAAARIVTFDDVAAMVPALVSGGVDALALTARTLRALPAQAAAGTITVLDPFIPVFDGVARDRVAALAFPRDDRSTLDAFEAAAEPLRRDGTIAAIFQRYGWSTDDLPQLGQGLACE